MTFPPFFMEYLQDKDPERRGKFVNSLMKNLMINLNQAYTHARAIYIYVCMCMQHYNGNQFYLLKIIIDTEPNPRTFCKDYLCWLQHLLRMLHGPNHSEEKIFPQFPKAYS